MFFTCYFTAIQQSLLPLHPLWKSLCTTCFKCCCLTAVTILQTRVGCFSYFSKLGIRLFFICVIVSVRFIGSPNLQFEGSYYDNNINFGYYNMCNDNNENIAEKKIWILRMWLLPKFKAISYWFVSWFHGFTLLPLQVLVLVTTSFWSIWSSWFPWWLSPSSCWTFWLVWYSSRAYD